MFITMSPLVRCAQVVSGVVEASIVMSVGRYILFSSRTVRSLK